LRQHAFFKFPVINRASYQHCSRSDLSKEDYNIKKMTVQEEEWFFMRNFSCHVSTFMLLFDSISKPDFFFKLLTESEGDTSQTGMKMNCFKRNTYRATWSVAKVDSQESKRTRIWKLA
jgi:hypothetical protein